MTESPTSEDLELRHRTETWLVRRGVPHFIDDYSASADVFTRAWPVLTIVFLLETVSAVSSDLPAWANVAAVLVGFALVVVTLALLNRARGNPWNRRPDTIGPLELTAFVLVPPLLPLLFGLDATTAAATIVLNLVVLLLVYVVVSYGLLPMTRWATGQLIRQITNVANLMIRSLPLLLIFTTFMFVNAEMWKVATDIPGDFYAAAILLLVVTGSMFMVIRMPQEMRAAGTFGSWSDVDTFLTGTPLEATGVHGLVDPPETRIQGRRSRLNVGLLFFTSQSIQIAFVALAIFVFYVILGILIVSPDTIALWTGDQSPGIVAEFTLWENNIVLTGALLRCSAFIAAVAGLQFTVSALTDTSYRQEFVQENTNEMRTNLAVRAVYLARFAEVSSGGGASRYKFVVLGPPGSGKGTHAIALSKRLSVPHISTGALLREEIAAGTRLGREVADAVRGGLLVPDEAIVQMVEQQVRRRPADEGWILDGAPRTLRQAELLAPLLEGEDPAIVLALDVEDDELRRRLSRRRTEEGRADDDPTVVEDRLALWAETGPRLLDRYAQRGLLVRVDGSGDVADTTARVWAAVEAAVSARTSHHGEPSSG